VSNKLPLQLDRHEHPLRLLHSNSNLLAVLVDAPPCIVRTPCMWLSRLQSIVCICLLSNLAESHLIVSRRRTLFCHLASRLSTTTEEPVTTSSALLTASHTEHACLDYDSHSDYDDSQSDYDDSPEKPKPDNSD
jgi:hypothetical protein